MFHLKDLTAVFRDNRLSVLKGGVIGLLVILVVATLQQWVILKQITPQFYLVPGVVGFLAGVLVSLGYHHVKSKETRLREANDRLAGILWATNVGTWEWNLKTGNAFFNERWAEIVGYTHDEISSMDVDAWPKLAHPDDLRQSRDILSGVYSGERENYECEMRMRHKDDRWVWVLDRGKVVEWSAEGAPLRVSGTQTDITERKNSDRESRRNERKFKMIVETTGEGFWIMDAKTRLITDVNDAMCRILGYDRDRIIGRQSYEFCDAANADLLRAKASEAMKTDHRSYEVSFRHRDGHDVPTHFNASTFRNSSGEAEFAYAFVTDLSAQKKAERQLIEARNAAEAANASKSSFLSVMSHEIRTPMSGVMGIADLLLEENLPAKVREKVGQIKGATDSLMRIINDILDISKMESGKLELEYIDFHGPGLIREVMDLFSHKVRAEEGKRLDLRIEIAPDFPPGLHSDPTRLRQILINLVGNAVKFTHAGHVTVRAERPPAGAGSEMLRFSVEDTGIGLEPEAMDDLFGAFTQADLSITRRFEGSGLGLSICKRLVEMMGGKIGVESEPGRGSTFWFTLPYRPATTAVEEAAAVVETRVEGPASHGLRILAAEDNDLNQQIIVAMMGRLGHEVTIAENGAAAVEAVGRGDFDLILMDVRMPEMSGPDATRTIRQLAGPKSSIPIIGLTADALEENRREYLEAGMDDVVTKPIDRAHLALTINRVMGKELHRVIEELAVDTVEPVNAAPSAGEADPDIEALLKRFEAVAGEDKDKKT